MGARDDVAFDEARHEYRVAGRVVPHVTGILAPLYSWERVPANVLERAALLGQAVHRATELHDLGTLDDATVHPLVRPYLDAWRQFRLETGFVPRLVERYVYNATLGYAGTLDREGDLERPTIIDIKSGTDHPVHGVQTAAYAAALPPGLGAYARACVYLDENGRYRLTYYRNPSDFPTFVSLVTIHHWRSKHGN